MSWHASRGSVSEKVQYRLEGSPHLAVFFGWFKDPTTVIVHRLGYLHSYKFSGFLSLKERYQNWRGHFVPPNRLGSLHFGRGSCSRWWRPSSTEDSFQIERNLSYEVKNLTLIVLRSQVRVQVLREEAILHDVAEWGMDIQIKRISRGLKVWKRVSQRNLL